MPPAIQSSRVLVAALSAVCLGAVQLPAQQDGASEVVGPKTVTEAAISAHLDSIRLDNGEVLHGRIRRELPDYVEIELGPDTVIGLARDRIVELRRGLPGGAEVVPAAESRREQQWFVVHGADGRAVGWLQETAGMEPATDSEPELRRLGQEWWFLGDLQGAESVTEITVIEHYDETAGAVRCFVHQRVRRPGAARLLSERIVQAWRPTPDSLVVETSGRGAVRERRELTVPAELTFPLGLAAELRELPAGAVAERRRAVFDPMQDEVLRLTCRTGGSRLFAAESGPMRVRVVAASGPRGTAEEWLQGSAHCLYRALSGSDLVARPADEDEARRAARQRTRVAPVAWQADAAGRMAVRLPNPAWRFAEASTDDAAEAVADAAAAPASVTALAPADGASFTLLSLDQVDAELLPGSALDAVLRWLLAVHPKAKVEPLPSCELRGRPAVAARLMILAKDGGVARRQRLEVHVVRGESAWFATVAMAPAERFAGLDADFDWLREHVELHPAGFAPPLRGPLAAPPGGRSRGSDTVVSRRDRP